LLLLFIDPASEDGHQQLPGFKDEIHGVPTWPGPSRTLPLAALGMGHNRLVDVI
jgi:hypothetical protein